MIRYLTAGKHMIYVLVIGYETGQFQCSLNVLSNTSLPFSKTFSKQPVNSSSPISILNDVIVPDIVEGALASPYFSVTVLNNSPYPLEKFEVAFVNSSSGKYVVIALISYLILSFLFIGEFEVTQQWYPTLQESQTLPVNFALKSASGSISCGTSNTMSIVVQFTSPTVSFNCIYLLAAHCTPFLV